MTEGRTKMEILKPDGKTIQFYQDKLDANISAIYKKEHPVVVSITQPTTTMVEPVATPKTENNIEPVQYREHPARNTTNSQADYVVDSKGNTTINKPELAEKSSPAQKPKEQHATVSSENLTKQAHNPQAAHAAVESISHSSKKVGETFSSEWIGIIASKLGKSV